MCVIAERKLKQGKFVKKGIMLSRYRMGALYPKHRIIFLAKEGLCSYYFLYFLHSFHI
nr:MAG TPA: hypothetical protein [Caudoviricetes sp.]